MVNDIGMHLNYFKHSLQKLLFPLLLMIRYHGVLWIFFIRSVTIRQLGSWLQIRWSIKFLLRRNEVWIASMAKQTPSCRPFVPAHEACESGACGGQLCTVWYKSLLQNIVTACCYVVISKSSSATALRCHACRHLHPLRQGILTPAAVASVDAGSRS